MVDDIEYINPVIDLVIDTIENGAPTSSIRYAASWQRRLEAREQDAVLIENPRHFLSIDSYPPLYIRYSRQKIEPSRKP